MTHCILNLLDWRWRSEDSVSRVSRLEVSEFIARLPCPQKSCSGIRSVFLSIDQIVDHILVVVVHSLVSASSVVENGHELIEVDNVLKWSVRRVCHDVAHVGDSVSSGVRSSVVSRILHGSLEVSVDVGEEIVLVDISDVVSERWIELEGGSEVGASFLSQEQLTHGVESTLDVVSACGVVLANRVLNNHQVLVEVRLSEDRPGRGDSSDDEIWEDFPHPGGHGSRIRSSEGDPRVVGSSPKVDCLDELGKIIQHLQRVQKIEVGVISAKEAISYRSATFLYSPNQTVSVESVLQKVNSCSVLLGPCQIGDVFVQYPSGTLWSFSSDHQEVRTSRLGPLGVFEVLLLEVVRVGVVEMIKSLSERSLFETSWVSGTLIKVWIWEESVWGSSEENLLEFRLRVLLLRWNFVSELGELGFNLYLGTEHRSSGSELSPWRTGPWGGCVDGGLRVSWSVNPDIDVLSHEMMSLEDEGVVGVSWEHVGAERSEWDDVGDHGEV